MSAAIPSLDKDDTRMPGSRVTGVVIGIVTNNKDPDGLGRVKVKFPWLSDSDESNWARMAAPMAGKDRGFYFLPEIDDEVLVVFEHGDMHFPYVLGALWNGKDKPPVNDGEREGNHLRVIKSRSGHAIRLTDEAGKEKIEIVDRSGNNKLVIDTATNTLSLTTDQDLELSAAKGKITLAAETIVIEAKAKLEIKSSDTADLGASGPLNIKGAVVNIN